MHFKMGQRIKIRRNELRAGFSRELYDRYFGVGEPAKKPHLTLLEENNDQEDSEVYEFSHVEAPEEDGIQTESPVTLVDLVEFYRSKGLVGEEKTCILQTIGAIHQLSFGIESLSGSGKSFTLDILMDLLPEDSVYVLKQSSDKAAMYDSERVNRAKVLVITELQKSSSKTMIEVLKDLGEGKDAERIVTNGDKTGVVQQKIESGKAVIYTLAIENWFKKDRELERRYFQLYTDISEEQTKKILQKIAEGEYSEGTNRGSPNESALRDHIGSCLDLRFSYVNPFAQAIIREMPLKIKSRSFARHYFDLIQACAKYHHNERVKEGGLFVNLEDVYLIHQLYSDQFFKSVLRVPIAGEQIVGAFDGEMTAADVYRRLKRGNSALSFDVAVDMLEQLVEAGYVEKDSYTAKEPRYSKIRDIDGFENRIDWLEVWNSGVIVMREEYPEIYERWASQQIEGGFVYGFNLITGEKERLIGAENGATPNNR